MAKLPAKYQWLNKEPSPKLLVNALEYFGLAEVKGKQHNPEIIGWAKTLNKEVAAWYDQDEYPWCALFMSHVCQESGLEFPKGFNAIRASGYSTWGNPVKTAMLGDVLVFSRTGGGHVGIYVGEDEDAYHVLGGNQGDKVSIIRILKERCTAIRRTAWKVSQPSNIRKVILSADGEVSKNEA